MGISHHDSGSHSGWILKMGESFLGSKNLKQRVGYPTSTDVEISAIIDGHKNLKWMDNLTLNICLSISIIICIKTIFVLQNIISKNTKT
jgi:hypothetical protein